MMRSIVGSSLIVRFLAPLILKRTPILVALMALALPPSSAGAQGTPQATQGNGSGNGESHVAAPAAAKACLDGAPCEPEAAEAPADIKEAETEEPDGELVGAARNESSEHIRDAFRYGIEGFRQGRRAKVEGVLEMIHEGYDRVPIIDEARLLVSVPVTMFGRKLQVGVTAWRDLTIEARSRVVGPELAWLGPKGLELTAGAYMGNINIEEDWGRFAMARVQAERTIGDLELLANIEVGRIHRDGDTRSLGDGPYHKYEFATVIPFTMIPGLRHVPGSFAFSIEFKRTIFSDGGPDNHETTKILGYEFPLTAVAARIGKALSREKTAN